MPGLKILDHRLIGAAECPACGQEVSAPPAVRVESPLASVHYHPACAADLLLAFGVNAGSGRTSAPAASDPDCNALRSAADSLCHCA